MKIYLSALLVLLHFSCFSLPTYAAKAAETTEAADEQDTQQEENEQDDRNPIGCLDVGYSFKMKTLVLDPAATGQAQTMYVFHNISDEPITLHQIRTSDDNRSVFMNNTIEPSQWAVLATNEKMPRFICSIPAQKSAYGEVVSCRDSLQACSFTRVRFGLNNRGSFWVVRNGSRNGAVQSIVYYGIIP